MAATTADIEEFPLPTPAPPELIERASALPANLAGAQCNPNPDFRDDIAGYFPYDNSNTGRISLSRVADNTAPNSTGQVLRLSWSASAVKPGPGMGGCFVGF